MHQLSAAAILISLWLHPSANATDVNPGPLWTTRSLVGALAKAGRLADGRAVAQQIERRANAGGRYAREDVIAMMWGSLGDNDRALAWWRAGLPDPPPYWP